MDTLTTVFLIGIGMIVVGIGLIELGISRKGKKYLTLIGLAVCAYAVLTWSGVSFVAEEAPPTEVVGEFSVACSESHSYVTVDNDAQSATWSVTYNHTTDAIATGSQATLTFSIDRAIGTVGLVQTSADVSSIPSVTNSTSGQGFPIISKVSDQYQAIWTRADSTTAYHSITLTIAEDADGTTASLNMTLNGGAIGSMDQFDTSVIGISVAGESWTVNVLLTDNSL